MAATFAKTKREMVKLGMPKEVIEKYVLGGVEYARVMDQDLDALKGTPVQAAFDRAIFDCEFVVTRIGHGMGFTYND